MKTDLQVMQLALDRLERGHSQGKLARNAVGQEVDPFHPDACQWCAVGALAAALYEGTAHEDKFAYSTVARWPALGRLLGHVEAVATGRHPNNSVAGLFGVNDEWLRFDGRHAIQQAYKNFITELEHEQR